jgi:hypothetical protein
MTLRPYRFHAGSRRKVLHSVSNNGPAPSDNLFEECEVVVSVRIEGRVYSLAECQLAQPLRLLGPDPKVIQILSIIG